MTAISMAASSTSCKIIFAALKVRQLQGVLFPEVTWAHRKQSWVWRIQMSARVEWTEVRAEESYWVIGDFTNNGWQFWEKSAWEIRWYPMATTPRCLDKAERAINACRQAA